MECPSTGFLLQLHLKMPAPRQENGSCLEVQESKKDTLEAILGPASSNSSKTKKKKEKNRKNKQQTGASQYSLGGWTFQNRAYLGLLLQHFQARARLGAPQLQKLRRNRRLRLRRGFQRLESFPPFFCSRTVNMALVRKFRQDS